MNDAAPAAPAAPKKRQNRNRRTLIWIVIQQMARMVNTIVFDLKTYGAYNVPKTGGVLLVSNHQSFLDPIILSSGLDRTLSYLAKAELFHNRFFGWLIRALNAFPVEQGAGDVGAVREAITRLQEGYLLNVYPEGARSDNGEMQALEKGVGLVVRRAKVPVVPVAIDGSFEAWSKHMKYPRSYPIRILIGPPMYDLWKLDRDEILKKIDEGIRSLHAQLKAGQIPRNPPRPVGRKFAN